MSNIERWTLLPPYAEAGGDADGMSDVLILRGFEGPKVKERTEVVPLSQLEGAVADLETLRQALLDMDEAVCHGNPETAKRIAREAFASLTYSGGQ